MCFRAVTPLQVSLRGDREGRGAGSDSICRVPLSGAVASQIQFPGVALCIFYPEADLHIFKYNTKLHRRLSEEAAGTFLFLSKFNVYMKECRREAWYT